MKTRSRIVYFLFANIILFSLLGSSNLPALFTESRSDYAAQTATPTRRPMATPSASSRASFQQGVCTTTRVSVASDGTQSNGSSDDARISGNGRYVAFKSPASNLVSDDTNGFNDIFVHDLVTHQTTRVSVASDGTQGNGDSYGPAISDDGRYVAFMSNASNLVSADTNNVYDVFVHDRLTGQTIRASVSTEGIQGNNESGLFGVAISGDGRYVAFNSSANNLVADDTNNIWDVFVHDLVTGNTERISIASDGTQAVAGSGNPSISLDGRFVAFQSGANNLVPGDTNNQLDVFVYDRVNRQTSRVSVASDGTQANDLSGHNVVISANGRYVIFDSYASNLVSGDNNNQEDAFVHDMLTGDTVRVSVASDGTQGNSIYYGVSISADGRFAAFTSLASNLVDGDTNNQGDVFVHDTQTGPTILVSVDSNGLQGNALSSQPWLSADGRYVIFGSASSNLVPNDTNSATDVFVCDRGVVSYFISGRVTDDSNNPTSGVTISSNSGSSTTTSASGYYTFTNVITGTYTISPTKSGYAFLPLSRNVTVPPNAPGQNFTARSILPWTVMFYLDGDNADLDGSYVAVFNLLESVANNTNVNIVVAWDRFGSNKDAYYKVKYDTNVSQLASYTENIDIWTASELEMSNPTTLSGFVQWARTNFPAQRYALVISDHGTGLRGIARDSSSGGAYMSIRGLGDALSTATSNGANKIDVVFADACLMGMIEPAYQIRNYASYYVASENEIFFPPGGAATGPYTGYISGIGATTTSRDLASLIVTQYATWAGNYWGDPNNNSLPYTISAVDLAQIDNLATAMSDLGSTLRAQMPTYASQIQAARSATQRFDSTVNFVLTTSDEYLDVVDFVTQIQARISDSTIQNQAASVQTAVANYRVNESHHSGTYRKNILQSYYWNLDHSNGVAVFVPKSSRSFYTGPALDFAAGTVWNVQQHPIPRTTAAAIGWGPMLVEFVKATDPTTPDDPNPPLLAPPLSPSMDNNFYLPFIRKQ